MDFNFGEIVEPTSRAFYDDYDDLASNLPYKRPTWKFNDDVNQQEIVKVKNFVIVDGMKALNVLQPSILKKTAPIASLIGHKVEVFKITEDTTICVVEEDNLNYFSTITELLEPWISKAENCSIVSLQSTSEYKSAETPESCLIRSIGKSHLENVQNLEAPNFITGVGAGVGTFRKMLNLPFSCFVIYIDIFDVVAIQTILKFLKKLNVNYDESVKLYPLHLKSDLYM